MSVFTSANTIRTSSLNGLWDFCPVDTNDPMLVIPSDGWEEDVYLAPSSWTGRGSEAFGYPEAWSRSRKGWLRRFIRVAKHGNRRAVLQFDAVGPRATVFLNGTAVGETVDAFTPFEVDITDVANPGVNELVVRILDTPRDEQGRARHPAGDGGFAGIWQDVRLVERADVHVARSAVVTSVREGRIQAEVELVNASRRPRTVTVLNDVVAWKKTLKVATADSLLDLGSQTVEIPARGSVSYTVAAPWEHPKLWTPDHPHLHLLRFRIEEGGHALYVQGQRFGFREVWSEGPTLFLNGEPLRIASDHGPAPALHFGTEGWIRRWFELLRATGLNHARLAGACASQLVRDLADEEGLLLTVETALNGETDALATDSPEFWVHAADHVRRLVQQDRNHPSVILWSVAHNVLHDLIHPSIAFRELPRMRSLVHDLDPTRPAYFDGDSMHWSPEGQDLMDGPPGRFESIYDAPDHLRLATAYAIVPDAERYINLARANGAAGIAVASPISALPRMPDADVVLGPADLDAPGLKLPRIPAGSAGLDFWSETKKSTVPQTEALRTYAEAFRKVAVIDTTPATASFSGQAVHRRVAVCNDSTEALEGTLEATFRLRDAVFATQTLPVSVAQGARQVMDVTFEVPGETPSGSGRLEYTLASKLGKKLDVRRIPFRVVRAIEGTRKLAEKSMAVLGRDGLHAWLEGAKLPCARLETLEAATLHKVRVLILEPHTVEPGSDQLPVLRDFVRKGGSLLVLEQEHSLFDAMPRIPHTAWLATRRNPEHPVFAGLGDDDLVCWDNRPVAISAYAAGGNATVLAGTDGKASLVEVPEGKGVVLACQLRIPEALATTPPAGQLLLNLVAYAASYRAASTAEARDSSMPGNFTPMPVHAGRGYPEEFWLRNRVTSAAVDASLVSATVRANADYPPVQIFGIGDHWDLVHRTNGWASAIGCSMVAPVYLFSRFHADTESSDLRLEGDGTVVVSVGGRSVEAVLADGSSTLRGIVLQKGYNAVLVQWKPTSQESRLRTVWCDAQGNPQTAFAFV